MFVSPLNSHTNISQGNFYTTPHTKVVAQTHELLMTHSHTHANALFPSGCDYDYTYVWSDDKCTTPKGAAGHIASPGDQRKVLYHTHTHTRTPHCYHTRTHLHAAVHQHTHTRHTHIIHTASTYTTGVRTEHTTPTSESRAQVEPATPHVCRWESLMLCEPIGSSARLEKIFAVRRTRTPAPHASHCETTLCVPSVHRRWPATSGCSQPVGRISSQR